MSPSGISRLLRSQGNLTKQKENLLRASCKRDVILGMALTHPPLAGPSSASQDHPTPQTNVSGASGEKVGKLGITATRREAMFRAPVSHPRDRITVDSGDGWGELAERKENFHSASLKRHFIFDEELEHPHLPFSSRNRPDFMRSKNLNVSESYILPPNMGKFNDPTLSLVNADALNTVSDSEVHPSDKPLPDSSRFGIPIPPQKVQFRDDAQSWLKHIIHENLRSRRRVINSTSTAGSRPSPMISGPSNPITPEIH